MRLCNAEKARSPSTQLDVQGCQEQQAKYVAVAMRSDGRGDMCEWPYQEDDPRPVICEQPILARHGWRQRANQKVTTGLHSTSCSDGDPVKPRDLLLPSVRFAPSLRFSLDCITTVGWIRLSVAPIHVVGNCLYELQLIRRF